MRSLLRWKTAAVPLILLASCSSEEPPAPGGGAANAQPSASGLDFATVIEPLVQEKCQSCHRAGGIAPFPLVTFDDVKRMGPLSRGKVQRREMPPWGAFNDPACTVNHTFRNDLSMTDAQVDTFVRWVDEGMVLGDPSKRPPPRTEFGATSLVDKTETLRIAADYPLPEGAKDDIECFPIDPGFTADTWIGASNVVPGDPKVVHHVLVYVDPTGAGGKKASGGHYPCFGGPDIPSPSLLLAWAPGVPPVGYGRDAGVKVPKSAQLVMQIHYHPGAATTDRTSVELKRLTARPSYVAQIILAGNATSATGPVKLLPGAADPPEGPAFLIPSNAKRHVEAMELVIPDTFSGFPVPTLGIFSVGAHMHWAGIDMKIDVERKAAGTDGQPASECLLGTPKYDFNWQRGYEYDAPLDKLPTVNAGDKVRFTCTYDNTIDNRHVLAAMTEQRMSVPPDIRLGETTLDEMCLGALVVVRPATPFD